MNRNRDKQKLNTVEIEGSGPASYFWQRNKLEAEVVPDKKKGRPPSISVFPVNKGEASFGVDSCTGLPKLPIEPLADSDDDIETPTLTVTSWNFNPHSGSLTGVMSNILSSPDTNGKSVTFEEQIKAPELGTQRARNSKPTPPHSLFNKCSSDSQLCQRVKDEDFGGIPGGDSPMERFRAKGRPVSLRGGGRSRSVIRLRGLASTLPRGGSVCMEPERPLTFSGQHPPRAFNTGSDDVTDRGSTSEGFHDDLESASPIEDDNNRHFLGRRSSFLYQSDSEDLDESGSSNKWLSRGSSQSNTSHVGDETYVTPFAQILATLHRMRSQYITLTGLPEDTRTPHSRPGWMAAASPGLSTDKKFSLTSSAKDRKLSLDILEELDWCLKKLETVSSTKSMGNMARDKFRRLLNRELSQLSEGSRKGAQVAEWVTNITNLDADVDRALDTMHNLPPSTPSTSFESSLSTSLRHDSWIHVAESANQPSLNDRIPIYGVHSPDMDSSVMGKYASGSKLLDWNVDVFYFGKATGDNPLICASYIIFKQRNLFSSMNIRPHTFIGFITAIQNLYHNNPFHNALHATDVLLSANNLLNSPALDGVFTDLEVLATLIAAAVHDVDHPGLTNHFLISVCHNLATLYNDNSVLENHHLATAFKTLKQPDCNILESFESEKILAFRKMVIDLVLATDIGKHLEYLAEFKTLLETKKVSNNGILVLDDYSERLSVLQCLLHCADLSNPGKAEPLAVEWAERVMEEFYRQGDKQKKLKMSITPAWDRENTCLPSVQVSFINYIIFPLWETWAELVYPDGQEILDNITAMKEYWTVQNNEAGSPSEDKTHTPRSSMSGSNETIKPDDYLPFNPDDSDTADQPSPMVQFYKKRMSSTSTEQARNSVDFNMSLGGSLRTQSSLAKMALAEREGRFINKPLSPMADRFASWQGDSQRLSQSAGGAMLSKKSPEAAARERRTSFKSAKYLPIAKEVTSSVDP